MELKVEIGALQKCLEEYKEYNGYDSIDELYPGYDIEKIVELESALEAINNQEVKQLQIILKTSSCLSDIYNHVGYGQYENIRDVFLPLNKFLIKQNINFIVKKVGLIKESENLNIIHIKNDISRMDEAYDKKNFGIVNSFSVSILQSLFKEICKKESVEISGKENIKELSQKALNVLKMDAKKYGDKLELRKIISKINTLIDSLSEIRNSYSSSHGLDSAKIDEYSNIPEHHYYLVMDTTKIICNFIIGSYDYQKKQKSSEMI